MSFQIYFGAGDFPRRKSCDAALKIEHGHCIARLDIVVCKIDCATIDTDLADLYIRWRLSQLCTLDFFGGLLVR
jgi:hypothetical protein